jgi:hypothetical protein
MTHVDNIPHILEFGITHKDSPNANANYFSIGDISVIDNRALKKRNITNGLDDVIETITIGDYIPFYFGVRTPMLFVIQKGGNSVPNRTAPEDIIYCVSSVQKIIDSGMIFYFADGHANSFLSVFYDKSKILEVNDLVDLKAAYENDWTKERDLKRRKEAEFLVKDDVPNTGILGYICYSESVRAKLLALGINEKQVAVRKNYYF